MSKDSPSRPEGIPLWAHPLPDEPAHGLFMRLAEINGYPNVAWIEREAGLSISSLQHGLNFARLASITHSQAESIARNSFSDFNHISISIRGERISYQHDYNITKRRVCPACLRESMHHRFFWDLNFLTSCPRHGLKLIDRCVCDIAQHLSWKDGRLYRGRCCTTGDIRVLPGEEASEQIQAIDAYFAGRLGIVARTSVPPLDELAICDAIELLNRVGALKIGGYAKRWQNSKKQGLPREESRAIAFKIITDNSLQDLLDATYDGFIRAEPESYPALTTAYGWFYLWYNKKGNHKFSPYLATEFLRHAGEKFHIRQKLFKSQLSKDTGQTIFIDQDHTTITHLAADCKTTNAHMKKIADYYGLIEPVKSTNLLIIKKSDADVLTELHKHLISKKDAAEILGFDNATGIRLVDSLIDSGLLSPFPPKAVTSKQNFRFLWADVFRLYNTLKAICHDDYPDDNAIALCDPHKKVSAGDICTALLYGHIKTAWLDQNGSGLRRIIVAKSELKGLRKKLAPDKVQRAVTAAIDAASFEFWRERVKTLMS